MLPPPAVPPLLLLDGPNFRKVRQFPTMGLKKRASGLGVFKLLYTLSTKSIKSSSDSLAFATGCTKGRGLWEKPLSDISDTDSTPSNGGSVPNEKIIEPQPLSKRQCAGLYANPTPAQDGSALRPTFDIKSEADDVNPPVLSNIRWYSAVSSCVPPCERGTTAMTLYERGTLFDIVNNNFCIDGRGDRTPATSRLRQPSGSEIGS
mmetsp:Transcript_8988/g.31818  ORF Transcript_8988/g.31818 Transcript_8988/m.31818 type:complete len:205 (+) Transcript_8988:1180-1794(+)